MAAPEIHHVTETARWVAAYRAQESESANPAFIDPYAAILAGEIGRAIADSMPDPQAIAFALAVRTSAMDRLIEIAIQTGVTAVLNLGAGFDTRPYRLKLPRALRWIEADFADLIFSKSEQLKSYQPVCRLERFGLDLTNEVERRMWLGSLSLEKDKVLVVTEGVIAYLSRIHAEQLAKDLVSFPGFAYWILDYRNGRLNHQSENRLSSRLGRAPFQFDVKDPIEFFRKTGWILEENIGILDEAERIGKQIPMRWPVKILNAFSPSLVRKLGNKTYGYALLRNDT